MSPIQIEETPWTLNQVNVEITLFEQEYGVSTEMFLANKPHDIPIDNFDAMDWLFAVECKRALEEDAAGLRPDKEPL